MRWVKEAGIFGRSALATTTPWTTARPCARQRAKAGLDALGIKHTGAGAEASWHASSVGRPWFELPELGVKVGLISGLAFIGSGALGKCTPATDDSAGRKCSRFWGRDTLGRQDEGLGYGRLISGAISSSSLYTEESNEPLCPQATK